MASSKSQIASQEGRLGPRGWHAIAFLLAICHLLLAISASAQTAPAGNAHPATQNVDSDGESQVNPFGAHNNDPAKVSTIEAKAKFAHELNLQPLRDLAVFHNGRVKVLDT